MSAVASFDCGAGESSIGGGADEIVGAARAVEALASTSACFEEWLQLLKSAASPRATPRIFFMILQH
jgi:hypothetical protein